MRDVFVGDGGVLTSFRVECDQQGFDPGVREFADHLVLGLRGPPRFQYLASASTKGPGTRSFLGAGVAVQIDDSHAAFSRSSFAVTISTSAFSTPCRKQTPEVRQDFEPLGSLNWRSPVPEELDQLLKLRLRPFFGITQAHIFSPKCGSGIARRRCLHRGVPEDQFSISSALIFSPPRLIRSSSCLDHVVSGRVQAQSGRRTVEALGRKLPRVVFWKP